MSVGLGVLGGIVAFLCVEKFVRIMKVRKQILQIPKHWKEEKSLQ